MRADQVTLGDALEYEELNLRIARQTLQERMAIVVERTLAKRVVSNKQHDAEHYKFARHQRPDRLESAKEEVQEAQQHMELLERYLSQVSESLNESLQRHSIHTHHDLQCTMQLHARTSRSLEKRIADMLALFDSECSATAAEAQRIALQAANAPRKITAAQAAAARITGHAIDEPADTDHRTANVTPVEEGPPVGSMSSSFENSATTTESTTAAGATDQPRTDDMVAPDLAGTPNVWISSSPSLEDRPTCIREPEPDSEPETKPEPEPTVAPDSFFPSMLSRRGRENGPWTRLSASEAAKSLGGAW